MTGADQTPAMCGSAHPYAGHPCARSAGHGGDHGNADRAWLADQTPADRYLDDDIAPQRGYDTEEQIASEIPAPDSERAHECIECLYGLPGDRVVSVVSIAEHVSAITGGNWSVTYESPEGEYGSGGAPYAYAIHGPADLSVLSGGSTTEHKEQYGHQITEITGLGDADAEFFAHAPEYVRFLLARVAEQDAILGEQTSRTAPGAVASL